MLLTVSNTTTLLRRLGMNLLQMECHWLIHILSWQSQFIQLRIAILKSFHTTKGSMLLTVSNTTTPQRRLGMNLLQMECHWLIHILSWQSQFIQLRIAILKSFHTTKGSMLLTVSNTTTPQRRLGMNLLQMECHWLIHILSWQSQFIQLRIAILKSFHTTKGSMLLTVSNITTPQRRLGMNLLQMECHLLTPILLVNKVNFIS
jgi:hypothetical protein